MSQQPGQPPEYPGPAYPEPGPRRQHRARSDDPYGTGEAGRHGSGQPSGWGQDRPEPGRGVPGRTGGAGTADPGGDPGRYRPDPERYGPGWTAAAEPGANPARRVPGWSGGDGTAGAGADPGRQVPGWSGGERASGSGADPGRQVPGWSGGDDTAGAGPERYRAGAQRHERGAERGGYGAEARGVAQESYWPGVADYGSGDAGAERAGHGPDRGGWPGGRHGGNRSDEPPYGADRGVPGHDADGTTSGWRTGGFGADRGAGGLGNAGGPADHQGPGAAPGSAGRRRPAGIQWPAGAEDGGRPTGPGGGWPPGGGSGIGGSGSRQADQADDTWYGFGDPGSRPGGGSSVPGPGRPGDERPEGGRRGAAPPEPEPYGTGRGDGTGGRPDGARSGGGRRAAGRRAGEADESSGGVWSGSGEWATSGRRAGEADESSGGAWSGSGERAAGGRRSRAARRSGEPAATQSGRPDLAAPPGQRRTVENDPDREKPDGERPPEEPVGRNTLALVAFLTGVVGLVPVAIACGLIALSQLKKRPRRGRLLAIGGLAFSGAWALVILTVITLSVLDLPKGNDAGGKTGGSSVSSFELAPGDCINGLKESQGVARVPTVPCADKHEGEVFALFTLTAKSWPGDATVLRQAEDGCAQRLAEYSSKAVNDPKLEIFFLHPTENSWKTGDRAVTCVAVDQATRTGSLRS